MNIIWTTLLILSIVIIMLQAPERVFLALISGGEKAISLSIKLLAIYAVWLGLLKLVELTQLDRKLSRAFKPALNFLFGKVSPTTQNHLSINLTGNLLGMGNASLPSGMAAMKLLHQQAPTPNKLTTPMTMLIILNTCNLQVIPSTVIGLRLLAGSLRPADIIAPAIVVSAISLAFGIALVKLTEKRKRP